VLHFVRVSASPNYLVNTRIILGPCRHRSRHGRDTPSPVSDAVHVDGRRTALRTPPGPQSWAVVVQRRTAASTSKTTSLTVVAVLPGPLRARPRQVLCPSNQRNNRPSSPRALMFAGREVEIALARYGLGRWRGGPAARGSPIAGIHSVKWRTRVTLMVLGDVRRCAMGAGPMTGERCPVASLAHRLRVDVRDIGATAARRAGGGPRLAVPRDSLRQLEQFPTRTARPGSGCVPIDFRDPVEFLLGGDDHLPFAVEYAHLPYRRDLGASTRLIAERRSQRQRASSAAAGAPRSMVEMNRVSSPTPGTRAFGAALRLLCSALAATLL